MDKVRIKNDRLLEVYKMAEEKCRSENRSVVLESDVVYAVLACPRSVVGVTCKKLGLTPELLQSSIANHRYPPLPYSETIERLAIDYFSKVPGLLEMALPEHLLFVLSRTNSFSHCLKALDIDPDWFVSELYRRSGKCTSDFPFSSEEWKQS